MNALPLFHRVAGEKIVVLGEGEAADAKRRLVERAGAICIGEAEAHHARLGFVAIGDEKAAQAAAVRLRRKGLLVNVTDRPALCDFTVPSIVDRAPVLVAVGTGGASAGLAKMLRLRLERILPAGLGGLAAALGGARQAIRARWSDAAERRRALDAALGEGGALDPLTEKGEGAVDAWLQGAGPSTGDARHAIMLRSLDADDLTVREARWLGSADALIHEAGVPPAILDRARADAVRHQIPRGGPVPPRSGLVVEIRLPRG